MSSQAIPLVTLNANQASSRPIAAQQGKPIKLVDELRYLAREAFMPKDFQLSRSLKQYLKDELPSDKRERTKAKIAELTAQYNETVDLLNNNYTASQIIKLWKIIEQCVVAEHPTSKYKQFRHVNPQLYVGEVVISVFMTGLIKTAEAAKTNKGLLAHQIVFGRKIYGHIKMLEKSAPGKSGAFFFKFSTETIATLSRSNYEKLFPNQKYYRIIVSHQIEQLEAAILSGKDHTDEGILEEVARFQVDYENMPRPRLLPLPAPAFNVSHPIAGMGLNTGYTPGGNAPVMVPTYAMSNNRGGLAFGYQASV